MAIHNGSGLGYKGDIQTYSVYELHVDGKVVLEAAVDNSDPELKIFIGKHGATFAQVQVGETGHLIETKGRAQKSIHEVGGADGEVPNGIHDHIDGTTIQTYVYPRAINFIVQLHVA